MVSEQFSSIRGNNLTIADKAALTAFGCPRQSDIIKSLKKCLCLNMEVRVDQLTLVARRFAQFLVP